MITEQQPRPICNICNKRLAKKKGKSKLGFDRYGTSCDMCQQIKKGTYPPKHKTHANGTRIDKRRPHNEYKGDSCENPNCTATIVDPCQLDVHHKDGNHENNERKNLITLCANCHRIAPKL